MQGQASTALQASGDSTGAAAGEVELVMPGMDFMMSCYEDELKKPIRNLVSGQLMRSLLIQVRLQSHQCLLPTSGTTNDVY